MEAIAHAETSSAQGSLVELTRTGPLPIVRVAIETVDQHIEFHVLSNTSNGVIYFDEISRNFRVSPLALQVALPYTYVVEFEAVGMSFKPTVEKAIQWDSDIRPPFIVEPELLDNQTVLRMVAVDSVWARQEAGFVLYFDAASVSGPDKVDPTIVNNPDFGTGPGPLSV